MLMLTIMTLFLFPNSVNFSEVSSANCNTSFGIFQSGTVAAKSTVFVCLTLMLNF